MKIPKFVEAAKASSVFSKTLNNKINYSWTKPFKPFGFEAAAPGLLNFLNFKPAINKYESKYLAKSLVPVPEKMSKVLKLHSGGVYFFQIQEFPTRSPRHPICPNFNYFKSDIEEKSVKALKKAIFEAVAKDYRVRIHFWKNF